jgi:shikimate dehydrogenase
MMADSSYMGFVGVTTSSSSMMKIFPAWAEALDLPTRTLIGHDIPLDSSPDTYRSTIQSIRDDPHHLGALVTTHKMAVFNSALDLFDSVDDLARTFGEISSVVKRGTRLIGAAKDPLTVRLALEEFISPDHFAATGSAALVLGSGGAGCALSYQLAQRLDAPSQLICTALSTAPLDHLRELHERAGADPTRVRYVKTSSSEDVDALLAELPAGSLVVNATGMGKDRPGSPISPAAVFPPEALVWEFNYRGSLEFLEQAKRQQVSRRLRIEDGWRYFIYGWSQVIADVFDIEMPADRTAQLSTIATRWR